MHDAYRMIELITFHVVVICLPFTVTGLWFSFVKQNIPEQIL